MALIHRRSPVVVYLLQWATSGVYTLWWLHRTMRDLNAMAGRDVFDLQKILKAGASIIASCLALPVLAFVGEHLVGIYLSTTTLWIMAMVVATPFFLWIVGVAYLHSAIARVIAKSYAEQGLPDRPSPSLAVVLFFAWFTALPYLQTKMNGLILARIGHCADAERPNDA